VDNPDLQRIKTEFKFDLAIKDEDKERYRGGWRFYRHRSERVEPNATKSAHNVLVSIHNSIEKDDLIAVCKNAPSFEEDEHINGKRKHSGNE